MPRAEQAKQTAEAALAPDPDDTEAQAALRPGRDPPQGRRSHHRSLPAMRRRLSLLWPSRLVVVLRARSLRRSSGRRHAADEPSLTRVPAPRGLGRRLRLRARACSARGPSRGSRPTRSSDMAALGVRTLYVQVANPDGAPANQLTDRAELRALLERAHEHDIAVVPWFLPRAVAPADDLAMMKQIVKLRVGGERFDGIGLDLESSEVPDIALRNRRTVAFAEAGPQARGRVGAGGGDRLPGGAARGAQPDAVARLPVPGGRTGPSTSGCR